MNPKDRVRLFWDRQPCVAEWSLQERNARFQREIEFITRNMPYESALDVGCGAGFDPINYSLHGCARVVGLDMSEKSLEVARSKEIMERPALFSGSSRPREILWKLGDAEDLPFQDRSFDFVSAIGSLHHTPDTKKAVSEMERVARQEIVLMLYNYWHYLFLRLRHHGRMPNYDNGCPIVKFYTGEQVKRLFHGFRVIELRCFGPPPFRYSPDFLKWSWYARAVPR